MRTNHRAAALAVVGAMSLTLAACGGDDDADATAAGTADEDTTVGTTAT